MTTKIVGGSTTPQKVGDIYIFRSKHKNILSAAYSGKEDVSFVTMRTSTDK